MNDFLERAKNIYGNIYDYSLVPTNITSRSRFYIICEKHGKFEKVYSKFINCKQGCPKCSDEAKALSTEIFVEKAKLVHNNKYDYSLIEYKNSYTKVKIICPKHGVFEQVPGSHLFGQICKKCSSERHSNIMRLDTNIFIERAKQVHKSKYDYSKTIYIGALKKVIITCPEHGEFKQIPNNHINFKNGCPHCGESHGEKIISEILFKNNIKFERQKTFDDCRNKNLLPFDFYLSDLNICVEYDGMQHFKSVEYFGGDKILEYIKK